LLKIKSQNIFTAAVILVSTTMLSNIFGVIREVLLAKYFGTSEQYDLYVLAQYVPSMVTVAFQYGLPAVFIPLYFSIKEKKGIVEAVQYQNQFFTYASMAGVGLILIGIATTPVFIENLFAHLSVDKRNELIRYNQILLVGTMFTIIFMNIRTILSAQKYFSYPAVLLLITNLLVIGVLVIVKSALTTEIVIVTVGIGMFIQCLMIIVFVRNNRFHFSMDFMTNYLYCKKTLLLAIPIIGIEILWGIFYYLDGIFGSWLEKGNVSAVNYALILFRFPNLLFGLTLGSAILPQMSDSFSRNMLAEVNDKYLISVRFMFLISMLFMVIIILFGRDIIELLFARGSFNERSIEITSSFLYYLAPGSVFLATYPIIIKVMNAVNKNKMMLLIFVTGIISKYCMYKYYFYSYGIIGIAFSINLSLSLIFAASFIYSWSILEFDLKQIVIFMIKNAVPIAVILNLPYIHPVLSLISAVLYLFVVNKTERTTIMMKIKGLTLRNF
jgi:putative peptidoglycan lipid II flippase